MSTYLNSILTNVSCGCGYLTECTSIHYIPRYLQKAVVEKLLATHLVQVGRNEPRHKRMQNDLCHFAGRKQGGAWHIGFKIFIFSTFSVQYKLRSPVFAKTLPSSYLQWSTSVCDLRFFLASTGRKKV